MNLFAPVLVPAVIGGLAWLVSWRLWNRSEPARHGHWGGALAFSAGYAAGHWILARPLYPPATALHWLFYLMLAAGVLALFERWWTTRTWIRWPVFAALCGVCLWLELGSMFEFTWSTSQAFLWPPALVLTATIVWGLLDRLATKRPGVSLPWVLWLAAAATSGALVLSRSALQGQLAGTLAGISGAAVALAFWLPRLSMSTGALTVFMTAYAGLLWQGHFYSELPLSCAVLLLAAPVAAWAGETPRVIAWPPWKATLMRLGCVAVPLAVAVGIALAVSLNSPTDDYSY